MVRINETFRVSILPITFLLLGQWATIILHKESNNFYKKELLDDLCYEFPSLNRSIPKTKDYQLLLQKDYLGFKEALAFKESQGKYFVVNKFGYLGKYQFGKGTLSLIGIKDTIQFLKSPELQEKAFKANLERNKWILRKDIKRFVGKKINNILITESGILAAAHLAGPGSVKKFLRSSGLIQFEDGFGTTITEYMNKFKSYDISNIQSNRKAKVLTIASI